MTAPPKAHRPALTAAPPTSLTAALLLILLLSPLGLRAATPLGGTPIDDGYHDMYNLQFLAAHLKFQQWIAEHPQDPMGPVSDAAAWLFGEFDRLHIIDVELFADQNRFDNRQRLTPDPTVRKSFDDRTAQATLLADQALKRNPRDASALMIEKRDLAALNYSKEASAYSKQVLAIDPTRYDAYLASGVENYMLSLKSAPLRWLLGMTGAATNREEGIRLLRLTAAQGHYLAPFARMMLAVAALRDNRPQEARDILTALSKEYPQNTLYERQLARIH